MSAETVALDWTYLDWAMHFHTIKGKPLSLNGYGFMVEPYEVWDEAQEIVLKFPNQVAKTEWMVGGSLYEADAHGRSAIYYFPTDEEVAKMVQERVDPVINASPPLRSRVYDDRHGHARKVARVHQKRIGQGWWHAKGAKSPLSRQATPADIVCLDEFSLFDSSWLDEIYKRLNASDYKRIRKISRPTTVGDLIEEAYEESDQRSWFVQCGHCGNRQDLDWFRDVVVQESEIRFTLRDRAWSEDSGRDIAVLCRECDRPLDRLGPGLWVPAYPEREVYGYHLTRLVTNRTTVRDLWKIFDRAIRTGDDDKLRVFYNGDLGLGYTPRSSGLDPEMLSACQGAYLMPAKMTGGVLTAGIDVQRRYLAVRISRILRRDGDRVRQAVFIGRVPWEGLDELFERFPVTVAVMDSEPETSKAKEMQERFPFLWLADYPAQDNPSKDLLDIRRSERFVLAQRNRTLDRSHAEMRVGLNHLPRNASMIPEYYEEMCDLKKVEEEDTKGNKRHVWRKQKRDDYRHADNYDFIAAELLDAAAEPAVMVSAISNRESSLSKLKRGEKERP